MSSKNIVWLASYPKSGNTWTRIFLANYLLNQTEPLSINEVHRIGIGDSISKTYQMVAKGPFDPGDHKAALALRGRVLKGIVANKADVNLVKTHNYNGRAFGIDLIPPQFTKSGVYILRNPLDVVISYARHYGLTPEGAVRAITRDDNTTAGGGDNVKQYLGNWSVHVRSWTRTRAFPILVLRYEDLKADPHATFARLLAHLTVPVDDERLDRAIRFSSFDELRGQEDKVDFIEKSRNSEKFFHTGTSGQWKSQLDPALVAQIKADHGAVMLEYGYLT